VNSNLAKTVRRISAAWLAGFVLHASAQQRFVRAAPTLTASATVLGEARFEIDRDTRSLIVTTDPETHEHIKTVIESLDKPIPQALIKVLFLEVTHGDDLDIGGEFTFEDDDSRNGRTAFSSLFGIAAEQTGGMATILENNLQVTLRALSEIGKLEVLSRPSIMARNNEEATIVIGKEVPFIRNSRITDNGQTVNTVEYEDIGIILTVRPHITSSGLIHLEVAPEISTSTGETVPISDKVNAPVFAKRSAETHVVVPSGKTVVIGGLMENQETVSIRKVPLLGDIWGLGRLFRREVKEKSKTELLIFLTPIVVDTSVRLAEVTEAEERNVELAPKAFTRSELEPYLPGSSITARAAEDPDKERKPGNAPRDTAAEGGAEETEDGRQPDQR